MAGTVSCTPLPDQGGFRIFIDWSAGTQPDDHLKVERIVAGQPDTLVRPAYAPVGPISTALGYRDTFSRIVASSWGSPDLGPPWAITGTATQYYVTGQQGVHAVAAAGTGTVSHLPISLSDVDFRIMIQNGVVPSGGGFEYHARVRHVSDNDFTDARLFPGTGNTMTIAVRQRVGGVETSSPFLVVDNVAATSRVWLRVKTMGPFLAAKAWNVLLPEPASWRVQMLTSHLSAGAVQVRTVLSGGVTNPMPVVISYDNMSIAADLDAPLDQVYHTTTCSQLMLWDFEAPMDTPVQYRVTAEPSGETVTSAACVFASGGNPWLIDPLSPCHNIKLAPCRTSCPPADAVIWIGHEQEQYAAVSAQFEVAGKSRPIEISQIRRDAVTVVHFATLTCAARDKLLDLTRPGTPVFIPRFDEVCWPGRYLGLGDHAVIPLSRDLRRTERLHSLPAVVVEAPPGPTCCVANTSWCDLCSCAQTWDEMDALNLTGIDVLEGEAVQGFAC